MQSTIENGINLICGGVPLVKGSADPETLMFLVRTKLNRFEGMNICGMPAHQYKELYKHGQFNNN